MDDPTQCLPHIVHPILWSGSLSSWVSDEGLVFACVVIGTLMYPVDFSDGAIGIFPDIVGAAFLSGHCTEDGAGGQESGCVQILD